MKKKNLEALSDLTIAYSTDKNFVSTSQESEINTLPKSDQVVRVQLYSKLKGGKMLTRIYGVHGSDENLEELCRFIKNKCGTGGSVKEGEILIQGNHVEKIIGMLLQQGFKNTKRSGG
jgi:translation initiation factor 1